MPEMQRNNIDSGGTAKRGSWLWMWVVISLPLFYVLSVGPAAKMVRMNLIPFGAARLIYAPLDCFCARVPGFSKAVDRYVGSWTERSAPLRLLPF